MALKVPIAVGFVLMTALSDALLIMRRMNRSVSLPCQDLSVDHIYSLLSSL